MIISRRKFIRIAILTCSTIVLLLFQIPQQLFRRFSIKQDPLIAKLAPSAFSSVFLYQLAKSSDLKKIPDVLSRDPRRAFSEIVKTPQPKSVEVENWILPEVEVSLWRKMLK